MTYWLVVWNIFYFSIQLGMSSSQLTNSFFSEVNHQITVVVSTGVVATGFLRKSNGGFSPTLTSNNKDL
jgi:hypothetical protein